MDKVCIRSTGKEHRAKIIDYLVKLGGIKTCESSEVRKDVYFFIADDKTILTSVPFPEGCRQISLLNEFKKGDYIVVLHPKREDTLWIKHNWCYVHNGKDTNYFYTDKCSRHECTSDYRITFDSSFWRYATDEEFLEYNRLGQPYDVTTLTTPRYDYKFKVGDKVEIIQSVYGCTTECIGEVVTILELGDYYGIPGYKTTPTKGLSEYEGAIGEESFRLYEAPETNPNKAVHCTTQEEWDFVLSKCNFTNLAPKEWIIYKSNSLIALTGKYKAHYGRIDGHINDWGYQILSFKEWCDENGYTIETNYKSEIEKWYKRKGREEHGGSALLYAKGTFIDKITLKYTERINNDGQFFWLIDYCISNDDMIEVDISEIQQYLSEGHPDKIETISTPPTSTKTISVVEQAHIDDKVLDYLKKIRSRYTRGHLNTIDTGWIDAYRYRDVKDIINENQKRYFEEFPHSIDSLLKEESIVEKTMNIYKQLLNKKEL